MPELVVGSRAFIARMAEIGEALASGWAVRPERIQVHGAALGHAISFTTWQSLTSFGLTDDVAAALMVGLVESTASSRVVPWSARPLRPHQRLGVHL